MNTIPIPADLVTPNIDISNPHLQVLIPYLKRLCFNKGDILVRQGRINSSIYILQTGLLRNYVLEDGDEKTRWFAVPGDMFCSMAGIARGLPSLFNIQAIEDSEELVINKDDLMSVGTESKSLLQWLVKVLFDGFFLLEQSYAHLEQNDAMSRYQALDCRYVRDIVNRIPLQYIASYIGVAQATLSRIRRKWVTEENASEKRCVLEEMNACHSGPHPFCRFICLKRNV